jgi:hypothetical protein
MKKSMLILIACSILLFGCGKKLEPGYKAFVDNKGKVVIQDRFEQAMSFKEGLAGVVKSGRWGFINHEGKLVIDYQFERVWFFSEGFAVVN